MIRIGHCASASIPDCALPQDGLLVSFNLASNNAANFAGLCANLADTAADPSCLEILVAIDEDDQAMQACIERERAIRPFRIEALTIPPAGYFNLWRWLNRLHARCDPTAYFVNNINDEIRFRTHHWDRVLRRYVDFFPDRLFRLRTSVFKQRAYVDYWENGYAPENYAFYTKRWIDLQGDWNPCHGPDAFQQFVAYYLIRSRYPASQQHNRDITIWDIEIGGEGVSIGLTPEQAERRALAGWKAWYRLVSHPMQEEALRRARHLQLYIEALQAGYHGFAIVDDPDVKQTRAIDPETGAQLRDLREMPLAYRYNLSWLRIQGTSWLRRLLEYYHCGGGRPELMPSLSYLPFRYLPVLYLLPGRPQERVRQVIEGAVRLRWETRRQCLRLRRALAPLAELAVTPLVHLGRWLHGRVLAPASRRLSRALLYDRLTRNPYDPQWRLIRARPAERAGTPGATAGAPGMTPARLVDGSWEPWGSAETAEDTVVWIARSRSFVPRALHVVLFSPGGRAHLRDVSVVATRMQDGRPGAWEVVPARLGRGGWSDRLEIPPLPDFTRLRIALDAAALQGKGYDAYGLACLSGSRGDRRNHLPDGRGIYLRELALVE